jgi:hypothetical protein
MGAVTYLLSLYTTTVMLWLYSMEFPTVQEQASSFRDITYDEL